MHMPLISGRFRRTVGRKDCMFFWTVRASLTLSQLPTMAMKSPLSGYRAPMPAAG